MKSSSVLPSSPLQQIPENNVSFKVSSHSLFSEILRPSGSSYLNSKYGSGSSSHLPGLLSSVQSDSSVQLLSRVLLFATPWTTACQASLSITNYQSLLKLMSIELVMPSNHLFLCCPLLLPSIFPSIRGFSNELVL